MQNPERDEHEQMLASLGTGSGLKLRPQMEEMAPRILPDLQRIIEDPEYCEYLWQRHGQKLEGQKPQVEIMGRISDNFPPITRDSFEMSLKSLSQALLLSLPEAQEEPLKTLLHDFHRERRREVIGMTYNPRTGETEKRPLSTKQSRWMDYLEACEDGDLAKVKASVEAGILKEYEGAASSGLFSALIGEVPEANRKVAEFLLKNGADIETEANANTGQGLLHHASGAGDLETVRFLLQYGAKVDGVRDFTGLDEYVESIEDKDERAEEAAKLKDVNYFGIDETPLIGAAIGGHEDIVRVLIEAGANVNAWCDSRGTALDCAEPNVVELLKQHGAQYHYGEQTN